MPWVGSCSPVKCRHYQTVNHWNYFCAIHKTAETTCVNRSQALSHYQCFDPSSALVPVRPVVIQISGLAFCDFAVRGTASCLSKGDPRVAWLSFCSEGPLGMNAYDDMKTRGQSNLTKSASRGAHSPVRGHPRGSKFVPLNSWGRVSY